MLSSLFQDADMKQPGISTFDRSDFRIVGNEDRAGAEIGFGKGQILTPLRRCAEAGYGDIDFLLLQLVKDDMEFQRDDFAVSLHLFTDGICNVNVKACAFAGLSGNVGIRIVIGEKATVSFLGGASRSEFQASAACRARPERQAAQRPKEINRRFMDAVLLSLRPFVMMVPPFQDYDFMYEIS